MKSLKKLALVKATQDRSWLERNSNSFKYLPNEIQYLLLDECLKAKNVTAFEEFILCLHQEDLIFRDSNIFTEEFALTLCNIIEKKNAKWKDTGIKRIDLSGCDIGATATRSFSKLVLKKVKPVQGYCSILYLQDWFSVFEVPSCIKMSFHVTRDSFELACLALSESDIIQPHGIKAESLGAKRICEMLDLLKQKNLPLFELDLFMNSLMKDGVIDVCKRLSCFKTMRKLNLGYAMISEEDEEAVIHLSQCLCQMEGLQELCLTACLLGAHFSIIFNSLNASSLLHLNLANCGIEAIFLEALAELLKNSSIRRINLQYNRIRSDAEVTYLLTLLESCKATLRYLDISNTGLTYDNARRLVQFFENSRMQLKQLWIQNKDIKDNDLLFEELGDSLPQTEIIRW